MIPRLRITLVFHHDRAILPVKLCGATARVLLFDIAHTRPTSARAHGWKFCRWIRDVDCITLCIGVLCPSPFARDRLGGWASKPSPASSPVRPFRTRLLLHPKRSPPLGACWHISLPRPNQNDMYTQKSARMLVMNHEHGNGRIPKTPGWYAKRDAGNDGDGGVARLIVGTDARVRCSMLAPGNPLTKLGGAGGEGGMRLMVQCVRTGGKHSTRAPSRQGAMKNPAGPFRVEGVSVRS